MGKDNQVFVRLTDEQKRRLQLGAGRAGLSVSAFVLMAALAEADATTEPPPMDVPPMILGVPLEQPLSVPESLEKPRKPKKVAEVNTIIPVDERCARCRKFSRVGCPLPPIKECPYCRALRSK